jgi:hypothetical protein
MVVIDGGVNKVEAVIRRQGKVAKALDFRNRKTIY